MTLTNSRSLRPSPVQGVFAEVTEGSVVAETAEAVPLSPLAVTGRFHVRDQKAVNTAGGAAAATTWNVRDLNTVIENSIQGASLATNQITLPAGTFRVSASAPGHNIAQNKLRLRDAGDTTTYLVGSSYFNSATDNGEQNALLRGIFTLTASTALELQHYSEAVKATDGLGVQVNATEVEVYADIVIEQLDVAANNSDWTYSATAEGRTGEVAVDGVDMDLEPGLIYSGPVGGAVRVAWDNVDVSAGDIAPEATDRISCALYLNNTLVAGSDEGSVNELDTVTAEFSGSVVLNNLQTNDVLRIGLQGSGEETVDLNVSQGGHLTIS
jgi:hypothetical protein